ncbi:hypothetical protein [Acidobacterium sp. S8]|nr:hypothetical protein [Acidobacterium sp. S8]
MRKGMPGVIIAAYTSQKSYSFDFSYLLVALRISYVRLSPIIRHQK